MADNIENGFDGFSYSKMDGMDNNYGNDLYEKSRDAVRAGLAAASQQYVEMDKSTIRPNKGEKALTGDDMASQPDMATGRTDEASTKKV